MPLDACKAWAGQSCRDLCQVHCFWGSVPTLDIVLPHLRCFAPTFGRTTSPIFWQSDSGRLRRSYEILWDQICQVCRVTSRCEIKFVSWIWQAAGGKWTTYTCGAEFHDNGAPWLSFADAVCRFELRCCTMFCVDCFVVVFCLCVSFVLPYISYIVFASVQL